MLGCWPHSPNRLCKSTLDPRARLTHLDKTLDASGSHSHACHSATAPGPSVWLKRVLESRTELHLL